ncbi:MAG: hypothetical protein K8S24_02995, partial [Candidatus Aegiribacteria sp.]|nr:hypothetical protein [Candidatus Aegiribacteria sp.]
MSTKPLLVLLDADVIIELHKVGAWDGVLTAYNVEVSEIIARQEVQFYYDSTGKRIATNLKSDEKAGRIQIFSATAVEISDTLDIFDQKMREGLHTGEIEAITILRTSSESKELYFCSGDKKACEAIGFLGLFEYGLSLEMLFRRVGLTKPIRSHFSE